MADAATTPKAPTRAEDVDLGVLDATLSFFVRSINTAVSRDLDDRLEGLDVARGTGKVTALFLVERHPGIRPSVIADVTIKDRSAMGRIIETMAAQGLIRRAPDPDDSRAQHLYLTERGEALAATVRRRVEESRAFFDFLDDEEYAQVLGLLRKIYWRIVAEGRGR